LLRLGRVGRIARLAHRHTHTDKYSETPCRDIELVTPQLFRSEH